MAASLLVGADRTSVPLAPGRTTTIIATADVGAPIERAVAGKFYAQAATADGEQRWADAAALYREAATEWTAAARLQPSRALDLAAAKAERERQRSQLLAARARGSLGVSGRFGRDPSMRRADALDEARQLRAKLMVARAALERVPPALYARTRDRLHEALRAGAGGTSARMGGDAEIHLLLCSTHAAAGDVEAARLARAHVTEAERADPANTVAIAACAAGLGETRAAIAELEILALHPGPGRTDRFALRDLYLANDWDRLRGDPKFESLFAR
jgi:hypothetical protein